jgi:hypothetical protein
MTAYMTDTQERIWPLEVLARLLDAPAVHAALRDAPPTTVVALVLSPHFHEETVAHGYPGMEPEAFHEVAVSNKEFTSRAWLRLAGPPAAAVDRPADSGSTAPAGEPAVGEPVVPGVPSEPAADGPRSSGPSRMTNKASGHGVIYATQNGDQHITINGRS